MSEQQPAEQYRAEQHPPDDLIRRIARDLLYASRNGMGEEVVIGYFETQGASPEDLNDARKRVLEHLAPMATRPVADVE